MGDAVKEATCPPLIRALMNPDIYDHPVSRCRLIQTHISWVILTGSYAFKIKKPLNLGFLNFESLSQREFFCREELRLNRRLAPDLYLSVDTITGSPERPQWNGPGPVLEYAVRMVQFPQNLQMDRLLSRGKLRLKDLDAVAHMIARFHETCPRAEPESGFGGPEQVQKPAIENLVRIREGLRNPCALELLAGLEKWTRCAAKELTVLWKSRLDQGWIRECHGDLHLKNMAWIRKNPVAFDCIEFNPNLRWIDVISEVAFLFMDLCARERTDMAWRFLNTYLESTGDYAGVRLIPWYVVYRALVRAKIAAIRMGQAGLSARERIMAETECRDYLCLAGRWIHPQDRHLIITRGVSGSGKSTITQVLGPMLGAIRIRSDVERKRIHGLSPEESGQAPHGQGIYTPAATERTFEYLAELAGEILDAGFPVIVDAAFLSSRHRGRFQKLAREKQAAFTILDIQATPDELRRRITARKHDVSDAGLDILESQLADWKPLDPAESGHSIVIDSQAPFHAGLIARKIAIRAGFREAGSDPEAGKRENPQG